MEKQKDIDITQKKIKEESELAPSKEESSKKVKINIDSITNIPNEYPQDFIKFCNEKNLIPPKLDTGKGKALALMLHNPNNYFTRPETDAIVEKFNINSRDSIQLFNKHAQWGIKCSNEKGKYYVETPYKTTNKPKMRNNFKYDGTEEAKNAEIDNIKAHLMGNYIEIPNRDWQLGHKNPDSEDNSHSNLVLQPPIQAKYRDDYIFIDTFTKMPTPKKLKKMIENKEFPCTEEQLTQYKLLFNSL